MRRSSDPWMHSPPANSAARQRDVVRLLLVVGLGWMGGTELPSAARAQGSVAVFDGEVLPGIPPGEMMYLALVEDSIAAVAHRDAEFEKLKTPEQVSQWQQSRRAFFRQQLGGFPERTPLNARTVGTMRFDGYRVEKVIFDSLPAFRVTATLYVPDGPGPFPGVIHPTGHSANAKSRDLYQLASIAIARRGCAVLCYDPVGQGERRQILDEQGKPRLGTTSEHTLINQGCILLGTNTARYMIWDGMRAIDYLQSRDDIDADKIGCTGISGGGTNTSYLMALDDRIVAAAPGCYLTGYESLLSTIGPQDAEQNIHGQLKFGMDHSDYVLMRAPQPTLIMAATEDYFDIDGAWRLFRQAKRTYTRLGFPERVDLVEPDTQHGFPPEMRSAAGNWMRRWLLNEEAVRLPERSQPLSDEALQCTPEGQVNLLSDARTVFDLNQDWSEEFATVRAKRWQDPDSALRRVADRIGWSEDVPEPRVVIGDSEQRDWIRTPVALFVEPKMAVAANLFEPLNTSGEEALGVTIVVNENGKAADSARVADLVGEGRIVLALDLRGLGETAPSRPGGGLGAVAGDDWRETTLASLLDRSYVGMRATDLMLSVRWLRKHLGNDKLRPDIVSVGHVGVPALHAVALAPSYFGTLECVDFPPSYAQIVQSKEMPNVQANMVFGALRDYDLPDLQRVVRERAKKLPRLE